MEVLEAHKAEGEPVAEEETYRRMRVFYEDSFVTGYAERVRHARKHGHDEEAEQLLDAYRYRMHNISEFMKTLFQRFTQNYNRRHDRHGTLWEGRFKSVLVEGDGTALAMLCAYVDLNAVRAGILEDPKDYRFCGYGEAMDWGDLLPVLIGAFDVRWRTILSSEPIQAQGPLGSPLLTAMGIADDIEVPGELTSQILITFVLGAQAG